MKNAKGIVLKVESKQVMVVTEEGDFKYVKMPKNKPLPGDTIDIPQERYNIFKPYLAIAAAIILILGTSIFYTYNTSQAYAAVSLDMTSSIELEVNNKNEIIKAMPNNKEGKAILNEVDIKNKDLYKSIELITIKSAQLGFFKSTDKNIALVTVAPLGAKDEKVNIDNNKLMNIIKDEMYLHEYNGYVVVNSTTTDIHHKAKEEGLSVNKYLLLEKSKENGIHISNDKLKNNTATEIIKEHDLEVKNMFSGHWSEVHKNETENHNPINNKNQNINTEQAIPNSNGTMPNKYDNEMNSHDSQYDNLQQRDEYNREEHRNN